MLCRLCTSLWVLGGFESSRQIAWGPGASSPVTPHVAWRANNEPYSINLSYNIYILSLDTYKADKKCNVIPVM